MGWSGKSLWIFWEKGSFGTRPISYTMKNANSMESSLSRARMSSESNRFPDCVFLKLHAEPLPVDKPPSPFILPPSTPPQDSKPEQWEVQLTIRFGKQILPIRGGSITFALNWGELDLQIDGGKMPLESIKLYEGFEKVATEETGTEKSQEREGGASLTGPTGRVKSGGKQSSKTIQRKFRVGSNGTNETKPTWTFSALPTDEQGLTGELKKEALGDLRAACPWKIKATFVTSTKDLKFIDAEGLWPKNIGRNKTAVIERRIIRRLLDSEIQPHLSYVELSSD